MFRFTASKFNNIRRIGTRNFGAHHGGSEPHVPEGYKALGQFVLYTMYFWVFYQFKENGAQLFGLYYPWHHPHEHHHHSLKFVQDNVGEAPSFSDDEDDDEHDDEHEEEHGHHH